MSETATPITPSETKTIPEIFPSVEATQPVQETFSACNTIYVKNLNYHTTKETLLWIFGRYGPIINIIIRAKTTTKGFPMMFCFITYETEEQATKALNAMNNQIVEGRPINVNYGKPFGSNETKEYKPSVKVSGIDKKVKADIIKNMFEKYLPIKAEIKLINKSGIIESSGVCVVEFPSVEMQEKAVAEMNGHEFNGNKLVVQKVVKKEKKEEEKKEEKVMETPEIKIPTGKVMSPTKVIVQNLHYSIRDEQLKRIFAKYNPVSAKVLVEKVKTKTISKEFGFLEFPNEEMKIQAIIEMNNTEHSKKIITVKHAFEKKVIDPERVVYEIPLKSYYLNETVTMEINNQQYKVQLRPEVREGKTFNVPNGGSPVEGVPRDLIIELGIKKESTYERVGNDLIQHVIFEKKYEGQTLPIEIPIIDGRKYSTKTNIVEGNTLPLVGYGFMQPGNAGTRGVYQIVIHIQ